MRSFRPAVVLACVLAAAPPASAAFLTSTVTVPSSGALGPLAMDSSGVANTPVSGTTDGNASDRADIDCYYVGTDGTTQQAQLKTDVAVGSDGSFSTTVDARSFALIPCLLVAVDHTDPTPLSIANFHGPRVGAVVHDPTSLATSGPNAGKRYDFRSYVALSRGLAEVDSIGYGGIASTVPFAEVPDSGPQQAGSPVFGNNGFFSSSFQPVTGTGTYRASVQVDGIDAVTPYIGYSLSSDYGWLPLTYSWTYDAAADRATLVQSEPLVHCPSNTPSAQTDSTNCSGLSSLDVTDQRTTVIDHHGLVIAQTDSFITTGAAKTLDVLDFQSYSAGPSAGYEFPGDSSFTAHTTAGETIPIASGSTPAAILYMADRNQPTSALYPAGSTSLWPRPKEVIWQDTSNSRFLLHYQLALPAGGSVSITRVYAQDVSSGSLAALTAFAGDRSQPPTVAITAPADATTVTSPAVTVTGTASDDTGVASVTVNGAAATLSGGTFSKDVTLSEGANTLTVVAADAAGNTATATRSVTYTPPPATGGGGGGGGGGAPSPPAIAKDGTVTCPAGGAACSAAATWTSKQAFAASKKKKHRRRVVLAKWSAALRPGTTAKATPTLTRAGRRLLRKRSVPAIRLIAAQAGTGTPVTATAQVRLKRLKHKKKKH